MIPKFKAWHHKHEAMYQVASIDFEQECITVLEYDYVFDFKEVTLLQLLLEPRDERFSDATELYEGDKVKVGFSDQQGESLSTERILVNAFGYSLDDSILMLNANFIDYIGNIYENPELGKVRISR